MSGCLAKAVTEMEFGQQILGIGLIFLQLSPQLVYESAEIFEFLPVFRAPDGAEELRVGDRQSGMAHQVVQ